MKLFEVPRYSRVKVIDDGKEYNFKSIDGMYSYCTDDKGSVVHLQAWTEVEIVEKEDPYWKKHFEEKDNAK
jgi:hypothetical protein